MATSHQGNQIPMHRWVKRQIALNPNVEPCLLHLQHMTAGKLLDCFQNEIRKFADSTHTLSNNIKVTASHLYSPGNVAYKAIKNADKAITHAYEQGQQILAVQRAEEFMRTLSKRLETIGRETHQVSAIPAHTGLMKQMELLKLWQKTLEALSTEDKPKIFCDEVCDLQEHDQNKNLKLYCLLEFWRDTSEQLLKAYSDPYTDKTNTIERIENDISILCTSSNLIPREHLIGLNAYLHKWQAERMERIQRDKYRQPLAAACFYSEALQDLTSKEDLIYFGLLFGVPFVKLNKLCYPSSEGALTAILCTILTRKMLESTRIKLNVFQKKIIKALCLCNQQRLALQLAEDWGLPRPVAPPNNAITRFLRLKPNDSVPLVVAFALTRYSGRSYYDLGIASGFSIPEIENIITDCNQQDVCRLRLLNQVQPLTRQRLEHCMTHPAVYAPFQAINYILRTTDRSTQWQPCPIQKANSTTASLLETEHSHFLTPDKEWFTLGYLLGVPFYMLFNIEENYKKWGPNTCFYHMLSKLQKKGSITIGQLAYVAQKHGFEHTVQYLPDTCKPNPFAPAPRITFPDRNHRLTASLLSSYGAKWKQIGEFFQIPSLYISLIEISRTMSDKEKLIRILNCLKNRNPGALHNRFHELIAFLQPTLTPEIIYSTLL